MKIKSLLILTVIFASGCASQGAWRGYSPVMSDIVGVSAVMRDGQLIVADKINPLAGRELVIIAGTSGPDLENMVNESDKGVALEALYRKLSVNIGVTDATNVKTEASGVLMDRIGNWAWMPIDQTFVYAGLRANSAEINFTSSRQLSAGKINVDGIGEVNLSAKGANTYIAKVSNPTVYYRVQLARVKQTFPGAKYSNGWITEGDPNVNPIRLSASDRNETWTIQPYQRFWKRWSGREMPLLSLVVVDSKLFVRSTRGIDSTLMPLEPFENAGRWDVRSAFVGDFAVGDLERKFIVLDIKASREGDTIVIRHARIRYPEVKLEIL